MKNTAFVFLGAFFLCYLSLVFFNLAEGFAAGEGAPVSKRKLPSPIRHASTSLTEQERPPSARNALSGMVVRPVFGFVFQNPKTLNSQMQTIFNNNAGINIGTATNWGLAADYPVVNRTLYFGVRVESFSGGSEAIKISDANKGTAQASLSGVPVMLTATYQTSVARGVNVGTTLGGGLAFNYRAAIEIAGSNDAVNAPNGVIAYASNPFCGLGGVFGTYEFTQTVGLRMDAGYRILSSNQLKATDKYGGIQEGELLVDDTKANMKVDGSAFYTGVSLQVTL